MGASDDLKKFFAKHAGGDAKDWKRVSKKKNAEGQNVRVFENGKTGVKLEVVELGAGQFKARRIDDAANAAFAMPALCVRPALDMDAARNAAADTIIKRLWDDAIAGNGQVSVTPQELVRAGRALANRFVFAVGGGGDGEDLFIEIFPVGQPKAAEGYCHHVEHVIGHLLPQDNNGEIAELTFDFSNYHSAAKLVSALHQCGFVWDAQYQQAVDESTGISHLPALQKIFGTGPQKPQRPPQGPSAP